MRIMPKLISAGFATCALASASMPALSGNAWLDSDFDEYANIEQVAPAITRGGSMVATVLPDRAAS
jgi:hypothetical protein